MSLRLATLAVAIGLACAGQAQAQQLTVATFGGSFLTDTKTCVIQPFEKATGATVAVQQGNSVQIAAAIRAMGGHPTYDVAYMDNSLATQLKNEGLVEPLDVSKLVSYPEVDKNAFGPDNNYVTFEVSATALVYDPKMVKTPPTSWNDLFDPKYKGRMALGDITGTSGVQTLLAINRLKGGTLDDIGPGLAAMKAIVPDAVTLYTQADQLLALFQRGDIVLAPWYPDRAGSAISKGFSLAVAYPKEGAVGIKPVPGDSERHREHGAGAEIHRYGAFARQPDLLHRTAVCGASQPNGETDREGGEDRCDRRRLQAAVVPGPAGGRVASSGLGFADGSARWRTDRAAGRGRRRWPTSLSAS